MRRMMVGESPARYGRRNRLNGSRVPRRMTEEEFVRWYEQTDETVRAEWVAGDVIMMSPDNLEHNDFGGFLYKLLSEFVSIRNLGRVFHSRVQCRLPVKPSRREPDIVFVAKARSDILQTGHIAGPPDLVMEVVSPSSTERDCRIKFYEYEEAGIPEYWIVHPISNDISPYALNSKGKYDIIAPKSGKLHSKIVPGFYLRKEWLPQIPGLRLNDLLKEMGAA